MKILAPFGSLSLVASLFRVPVYPFFRLNLLITSLCCFRSGPEGKRGLGPVRVSCNTNLW